MSDLFTVSMVRHHVIKKYDSAGRLVATVTEKLPVTYCDLPETTAQMYRQKFPDAEVTITKQAPTVNNHARTKLGGVASKKPTTANTYRAEKVIEPSDSDLDRAARTGDMAEAINRALEDA